MREPGRPADGCSRFGTEYSVPNALPTSGHQPRALNQVFAHHHHAIAVVILLKAAGYGFMQAWQSSEPRSHASLRHKDLSTSFLASFLICRVPPSLKQRASPDSS